MSSKANLIFFLLLISFTVHAQKKTKENNYKKYRPCIIVVTADFDTLIYPDIDSHIDDKYFAPLVTKDSVISVCLAVWNFRYKVYCPLISYEVISVFKRQDPEISSTTEPCLNRSKLELFNWVFEKFIFRKIIFIDTKGNQRVAFFIVEKYN